MHYYNIASNFLILCTERFMHIAICLYVLIIMKFTTEQIVIFLLENLYIIENYIKLPL